MATVEEIIKDAQTYADQIAGKMDDQQRAVIDAAAAVPNFPTGYVSVPPVIDSAVAAISTITGALPATLVAGTFSGSSPTVPTISVPALTVPSAVSDFSDNPETVTLDVKPTAFSGQIPNAPALNSPSIPDAPTYNLPTLPTLAAIELPVAPTFTLPTLYATAPAFTLTPPENTFAWAEIAFDSDLQDELKAKLLNDIQNGGYGIEVSDEVQIWDRAASRERATGRSRSEEAERNIASRGFEMPPGALLQAQRDSIQALQDASNTLSREVAIKRADLFVQNRQFTIQQTQQLVTTLLSYHGAMMERLLNAAKYTSEASIAYFNILVERARILLLQYQTEVDVWVKTIEGEKAKVEIYRITLEAARVKGELDMRQVEIYKAQLQGIQILTDIYKTRLGAMQAFTDIEKFKVEIFRSQIDGFNGSIKAKELELQAYEASIRGETAKQEFFKNKISAHAARISARKLELDGNIEVFRSGISQAEFQVRNYEVELKRYEIDNSKFIREQTLNTEVYRSNVTAFSAKSQAAISLAQLTIQNNSSQVASQVGLLNFNLGAARLQLDNITNSRQVKTSGAVSVMNSYAQSAAAALSGINAIASQSTTS